jgi:hypothetical protein
LSCNSFFELRKYVNLIYLDNEVDLGLMPNINFSDCDEDEGNEAVDGSIDGEDGADGEEAVVDTEDGVFFSPSNIDKRDRTIL